jgi:hypothetical protein
MSVDQGGGQELHREEDQDHRPEGDQGHHQEEEIIEEAGHHQDATDDQGTADRDLKTDIIGDRQGGIDKIL